MQKFKIIMIYVTVMSLGSYYKELVVSEGDIAGVKHIL